MYILTGNPLFSGNDGGTTMFRKSLHTSTMINPVTSVKSTNGFSVGLPSPSLSFGSSFPAWPSFNGCTASWTEISYIFNYRNSYLCLHKLSWMYGLSSYWYPLGNGSGSSNRFGGNAKGTSNASSNIPPNS